ncbi:MAG: tetratricopeptide repeat protein [Acidobacteriota bacterium]
MAQKLTRKEIKKDEFAEALGRTVEYAEGHVKLLVGALAGVIALVLLIVALVQWNASKVRKAGDALEQAMKTYDAPIVAEGETGDDADEPSFSDEEARRNAAEVSFQEVVERYGATGPGGVAAVYLGRISADRGDLAGARQHWEGFLTDHEGQLLAGQVRRNLLALDRAEGKQAEVASELEAMMELNPEARPLPGDVILFELGTTYEELDRGDDAKSAFQRLVEEYPESAFAAVARQKSGPTAGLGA